MEAELSVVFLKGSYMYKPTLAKINLVVSEEKFFNEILSNYFFFA